MLEKQKFEEIVALADDLALEDAYDALPPTEAIDCLSEDIEDASEILESIDEEEEEIPEANAIQLARLAKGILLFLQNRMIKIG